MKNEKFQTYSLADLKAEFYFPDYEKFSKLGSNLTKAALEKVRNTKRNKLNSK